MLNADQYVDYAVDALTNAGIPVNDKFYSDEVRKNVTDWQEGITKTAPVQEVNISFSGGSEKFNLSREPGL